MMNPDIAMEWSYKQISDRRKARKKKVQNSFNCQEERVKHVNKWIAPAAGLMKLNVDASVFEGAESFSLGMVIRDHRDVFLHGRTLRFAGKVGVLEAELIGIMEALKWTSEFHDQAFCVESDSILGVQAINETSQNHLEAGVDIEQCRSIISSRASVSLSFVKKQANKDAHLMARLPCMLNSFVCYSSPPLSVLETIMSDA